MSDIITTTKDLERFLSKIKDAPFVTLDTEFMRERTYYPELCLIQIANDQAEAVAIDPLANDVDLRPLFDFLDNPDQRVVLHAASQDLEIFHNLSGRLPTNLYDTQIAASYLGHGEQIAYKTMVQVYCHADVSKAQQFTDWSRRPLKEDQISYALSDVTYLATIYEKMENALKERGRDKWVAQEMDKLHDTSPYDLDYEELWQRVKIRSHKGRDLVVVKYLAAWREKEAQKRNVPKGRVLKDEALAQIAMIQPKTEKDLDDIRFFGAGRSKSSDGRIILKLVKEALASPKTDWPQREKRLPLSSDKATALELLKMLLRVVAAEHDIGASKIASNDDLEQMALHADTERAQNVLKGWRYDIFGREAYDLVTGKVSLSYKDGKIHRQSLESAVR